MSARDLEKYDLNLSMAMSLYNPLSVDLMYMRPSLLPSFLKDIALNQGTTRQGRVFELARVYLPRPNDLPEERTHLVFGEFGVTDVPASFLNTKSVLLSWAQKAGLEFGFERLTDNKYWHPGRSVSLVYKGQEVGVLGQVAPDYQKRFGIDALVLAAYLDFGGLVSDMRVIKSFLSIPEFPAVSRDIALVFDRLVEFIDIERTIKEQDKLIERVNCLEEYRGVEIPTDKKSLTLALTLRAQDRTLQSAQVDYIVARVINVLQTRFSAIIR